MTIFPAWYTDKGFADATDKVWASDEVTNFNITVDEIGTEVFANRTTSNLTEGTNLYYTDGRVTANATVVALWTNKADKTNVLEKDNVTAYSPTTQYHPATKWYVDNLGTNITGLTTENNLADGDEFIFRDISASANRKTTFSNTSEKIRIKNHKHEIVGWITLTFDDVAQSNIVINHTLWVIPTKLEFIFEAWNASDWAIRKWYWCDNGGTKTSYAYFKEASTSTNRTVTTNQCIATYNDSNASNGEWRVASITSTQITLSYTIVADGGTWSTETHSTSVIISA